QDEPREKMEAALESVRSQLGQQYPIVIGGKRYTTDDCIISVNPARPKEVVGAVASATPRLAEKAIEVANAAFIEWSREDPISRARCLAKAAAIIRRRIYELSAWMVFEVSKSWAEAYADTAEAIDFLEFYAREMMRLADGHPTTPYAGEENEV